MRPTDPRLVRRLAPARRPLVGVVAGGAGTSLLVLGQAWLVAGLVVAVAHGGAVRPWAVSVVAVFAVRGLVGIGVDVAASRAAGIVGTDVRRDLLTAVLSPDTALGRAARGGAGTGETAVLATRGVAAAEPYLTRYLPALVLAGVLPLVTVVAIATQDVMSAVIVLATLPLIPVFGALVGLATRDRAAKQWREMSSLSGHFVDVMRGLPTLVAFRRARAQTSRIREVTERYRQASLATLRIAFASSAVLELVATLSVALVAVTVGVRLAGGGLDLRTALVVLLLAPEAYWPLRRVGAEFHAAAEGVATFERVDNLLSDMEESPAAEPSPASPGDLVVDDVTVTYAGRTAPALDRVSLTVATTGITAVTGASGCGKSTLLSVLSGLRAPDAGSVRIGDREVGGEAWRARVALLPQRPLFVAGSIADNVRLGAPDASDDDVWQVLRRVALEERVRELPSGLETTLGEDGGTLSAGERARLALARVVLSDRPWVLLDEPTAHLDALSEHIVADTLVELAADRAVVVVAHRPALVDLADHVVHLAAPRRSLAETSAADEPGVRRTTASPADDLAPAASYRRSGLALPTVIGGLASASGVALTATSGWLIVQAAAQPAVLTLLVAIVGVRTFGLARPVLRYVERLLSHDAVLGLLAQRRAEVYDALVPLTPARLGPRRGDVLASVVDDVDGILDRELRGRMPTRALLLVAALAVAVTAAIAPVAALVVAGCVTAAGLAHLVARIGARRGERDMVAARALLSERVLELTQAADELVMWQARDRAVQRVAEASDEVAAGATRSAFWLTTARALALTACGVSVAGVAALLAPEVAAGRVSAPLAALVVLLPLALAEVILPAVDAGAASARAEAAETRLQALLALTPAVTGPEHAVPLPDDTAVDVVDVIARWDERPALSGLSLRVAPGQRVGVVGPSGSGKSTLASLLMRFVDPEEGTVGLGGVGLPSLALDDVRRTVGLVDDDPHVFATTVAENIRLARPAATDDEVDEALRDAGLDTWLDGLDEGLSTRLGDGAAAVSGGERARLGVARSLLADQRVLVLDEPTAHLDHANAELLARQVLARDRGRTVVWITHEPLGLDLLDFVIALETSEPARTSP
ncbi:thiol reductant ABC exporter subunit CydD [Nocardioides cynanchi]|uniref:thiol reductant ABC exporter subunit CydD n=1 Tax=Nocardioides cynanchi TaxID=2558918 RepID=UPI00124499B3|nr:thiol reductant ABC exporter subunit CydD [Nocardioides cynanchi]